MLSWVMTLMTLWQMFHSRWPLSFTVMLLLSGKRFSSNHTLEHLIDFAVIRWFVVIIHLIHVLHVLFIFRVFLAVLLILIIFLFFLLISSCLQTVKTDDTNGGNFISTEVFTLLELSLKYTEGLYLKCWQTQYLKNRFPNGHQVVVFLSNALQLRRRQSEYD